MGAYLSYLLSMCVVTVKPIYGTNVNDLRVDARIDGYLWELVMVTREPE